MNPFKDKLTYVITLVMTYYMVALNGVWLVVPEIFEFRYSTTFGEKAFAYGVTTAVTALVMFPLALGIVYAIKLGVNNKKGE